MSVSDIPVNVTAKRTVLNGDTTSFSDNINIQIIQKNNSSIKYFELFGDGFYYSPVKISMKDDGKTIEVSGQKSHTYTFLINSDSKPKDILESDNWSYDSGKKQITAVKNGIYFKLHYLFH